VPSIRSSAGSHKRAIFNYHRLDPSFYTMNESEAKLRYITNVSSHATRRPISFSVIAASRPFCPSWEQSSSCSLSFRHQRLSRPLGKLFRVLQHIGRDLIVAHRVRSERPERPGPRCFVLIPVPSATLK